MFAREMHGGAYIDQLVFPMQLRPFFWRPAVWSGDLVKFACVSWADLASLLRVGESERTLIHILCASIPILFFRSSFVPQSVLVAR